MSGIIGKKIGMTTVYENSISIACTVIEAGPCVITQIKTNEKDKYEAIQLSYEEKKEKHTTKALKGHFNKANTTPKRKIVEFKKFKPDYPLEIGKIIKIEDIFNVKDKVKVIGTSKGKGFQGVVKRHGFSGVGGATHGQHNRLRAPGSIGSCSFPSRVFKGMRMAGRTGSDRVKISNIEILKIIPEQNIIVVSGSVPGAKNSYIIIEK